jgi:hypothetical protein
MGGSGRANVREGRHPATAGPPKQQHVPTGRPSLVSAWIRRYCPAHAAVPGSNDTRCRRAIALPPIAPGRVGGPMRLSRSPSSLRVTPLGPPPRYSEGSALPAGGQGRREGVEVGSAVASSARQADGSGGRVGGTPARRPLRRRGRGGLAAARRPVSGASQGVPGEWRLLAVEYQCSAKRRDFAWPITDRSSSPGQPVNSGRSGEP